MEVKVTITTHDGGYKKEVSFTKAVNTFDELKTAFLKRFGNMNDETNKLMDQKKRVKQLTYDAENLDEWVRNVNMQTGWRINVVPVNRRMRTKK